VLWMTARNICEKEIRAAYRQCKESIIASFKHTVSMIEVLPARVKDWEDRKAKNSGRINRPRLHFGFNKPALKRLRKQDGGKCGDPQGQPGFTYNTVEAADCGQIQLVKHSSGCHGMLEETDASHYATRQVFDIQRMHLDETGYGAEEEATKIALSSQHTIEILCDPYPAWEPAMDAFGILPDLKDCAIHAG
jgi:hypothetical protein